MPRGASGAGDRRRRPSRHRWGRVRQLPSGRWQARAPHPTNPGRLVAAPQTFAARVDAERWLAAQETDQARGAWVDPNLGRVSFAEWAEAWLSRGHKRESTRARDRHVASAHLIPALGKRPLATISPLDVRGVIDAMEAKGLKPATVRTNYGVLRAMLTAAVDADRIARTPCRGIELRPDGHKEHNVLTPEDFNRLANRLDERYRPMLYLAGVLGLRWSEIAALKVKRVDFFRGTLVVAEAAPEVNGVPVLGTTKSRASTRTISVPHFILEMLTAHLARRGLSASASDELVFVAPRGGPMRASNFRNRVWDPAVEAAGLKGLTFHDLRHVAASLMVSDAVHPRVIQHRLGHGTARLSLELYSHVTSETDRQVADLLERRFQDDEGHAEGTNRSERDEEAG